MHIIIEQIENTESNYNRLVSFLYEVDTLFYIPLSEQGPIEETAKKWLTTAIVLIAFDLDAQKICGTMIAYANDEEHHRAYTAIKVVSEAYQHHGIMKMLRARMCTLAKAAGMEVLRGNINQTNIASINDMKSAGGKLVGSIDDKNSIHYGELIFEMAL